MCLRRIIAGLARLGLLLCLMGGGSIQAQNGADPRVVADSGSSGSGSGATVPQSPTDIGAPVTSSHIPLRYGTVNAVSGALSLAIPVGPKLPGRLTIGFVWTYDSAQSPTFNTPAPQKRGPLSPIIWPSPQGASSKITVWVNGQPMTFLKTWASGISMPSTSTFRGWLAKRKVDNASSFPIGAIYPSESGTSFLSVALDANGHADSFGAMAIISGDEAIWTLGVTDLANWNQDYNATAGIRTTYFSNISGDRVSAKEEIPFCLVWGGASNAWDAVVAVGSYYRMTLRNENNTAQSVSLAIDPITSNTAETDTIGFHVTNTLGLPKVDIQGQVSQMARQGYSDPFLSNGQLMTSWMYLGVFDMGFAPRSITSTPTDGTAPQTLTLQWSQTGTYGVFLSSLTHPTGLVESFGYTQRVDLGNNSYSRVLGNWLGFNPTPHQMIAGYVSASKSDVPDDSNLAAISSVTFTGTGLGQGQLVKIANTWPVMTMSGSGDPINGQGPFTYTWAQPDHSTVVLTYSTASPTSSTPFRGVRLTHPSGVAQSLNASIQGFLFATSAILKTEKIHGTGLPTAITSYRSWAYPNNISGWTLPSDTKVDQTTVFDGWDLRCWANPTGALAAGSGLPVHATATRIRKYTPGLPTQTRILSEFESDNYGYRHTDEYTDTPGTAPTVDPRAAATWQPVTPPSSRIVRTGRILDRGWDGTLGLLLTKQEQKTLTGPGVQGMRGVASVDFGVTTTTFDDHGRPSTVTGTRGGSTATDTRTYAGESPVVTSSTKTISVPEQTSVAFSGQAGTTATTDGTPFQWITSETDKLSGRTTTINTRDDLGRITLATDPDGIQTSTDYDALGRVWHVTRLAAGAPGSLSYAGPLKTTIDYAGDGSWRKETVEADGMVLVTKTTFDAFGREIQVDLPDGRTKKMTYDGFGQKLTESAPLLPLENYGSASWTYDPEGRVTASFDAQNRRLSSIYDPKDTSHTVQKPVWSDAWQGVVSSTWDDDGNLRLVVQDLLGQQKAVVDQKGQVSRYGYDKDGHLIATDQGGQSRQYRYNDVGWLLSRTEPEEGTTFYSDYTILGLAQTVTQAGRSGGSQVVMRTALDSHHRPTNFRTARGDAGQTATIVTLDRTIHYQTGTSKTPDWLLETQPFGQMREEYQYDSLVRAIGKTITDGVASFAIAQSFYDSGAVKSLTYPSGGGKAAQTLTVAYDNVARPSDVLMDGANRAHMDYDQSVSTTGYQNKLTYGNANTTTSTMTKGELTNVTHTVTGSTIGYSLPNNKQLNGITWSVGGLMMSRGGDSFLYDELKRLRWANTKGLNPGESMSQSFVYDRYGNRTGNATTYTPGSGGVRPEEPLAWTAAYDPSTNSLPTSLSTAGGNLDTGAAYDDLGRLMRVWAIPGQSSSLTSWQYDDTGRVVKENGKTFLLDGEGLRFKRMNADQSVSYTVYGFHREPLSVYDVAAPASQAMLGSPTLASASKVTSTSKTASLKMTPSSNLNTTLAAVVPVDILQPQDGTTVMAGYPLRCQASTDVAPTPTINWNFGDGGTAKGLSATHIYKQLGDFTVACNGTGVTVTVTPPPAPTIQSFTGAAAGNATGASVLIVKGQSATLSWAVSGVLLSNSINQSVGAQANSGSVTVSPTVTTTYTLTTTNLGGTRTQQVTVSVLDITAFTATPANLTLGGSSTLAWTVTGGAGVTVSIDQGIGTVVAEDSRTLAPQKTTTYTLTATCTAGSMTKSITVGLNAPILTNVVTSATRIALNGSATLSWNVTGAAEVRILANGVLLDTFGNPVAPTGSLSVSPTTTTTYTVEAMNATAMMMDTVTVDVVAPPIISGFGAMPSKIVAGDMGATLTWNAFGYDDLSISSGVGTVTASGVLVNPTATTTYTLTATNIAGTVNRTCTVTVVNTPIIRGFTASPLTIQPGGKSTLLWDVGGATSLSISGVTATLGAYSVSVTPVVTTTYTLTAGNALGSTTASVTVGVNNGVAGGSTATTHNGNKAVRIWHKQGTNCSISKDLGTYAAGDVVTAKVWFMAESGVYGQVFLGDADGSDPYDNYELKYVVGNGQWQCITVSHTMTHADTMFIYLYGDRDHTTSDTVSVIYDDVSVASAMQGLVLNEGFEAGVNAWGSSGQLSEIVSSSSLITYNGLKAVRIWHKQGTNCSISKDLGTYAAGDVVTTKVWLMAESGVYGQVFLGDAGGSDPYDNYELKYVVGNGQWQCITLSHTMTHADTMVIYLYGDRDHTTSDTVSVIYDDVSVASAMQGLVLNEGFEGGVDAWGSSGQPNDIVNASPGASTTNLSWQRSLIYGFGCLIAEERPTGTVYIQSDQVGTPNLLTNTSGMIVGASKNLPFGERFGNLGDKSLRRYTNHEDQDGSPIYMQARTYLPAYGKFAQVDPAYDQTKDDPESWNLYNYVTNNPVTHTDPDGREMPFFPYGNYRAPVNSPATATQVVVGNNLGSKSVAVNFNTCRLSKQQRTVYSLVTGTVIASRFEDPKNPAKGWGWRTTIKTADGKTVLIAHMEPKSSPKDGTKVAAGDAIGYMGDPPTGDVRGPTGVHAHVEYRDENGALLNSEELGSPVEDGDISSHQGMRKDGNGKMKEHKGTDWIVNPGQQPTTKTSVTAPTEPLSPIPERNPPTDASQSK